ncbi:hypothetical protein J437_LFUL000163 [Ladona fulva]|uniref:Poly(A)-specific ribonuclease RNA-binding domain-containing protein n=1 Tax=Ladona fulva TaxID=123851 RepID=A0A8K0KC62_LADFU|nr:hypothetical protein J437_LFUL000163 [Ladona fulva]
MVDTKLISSMYPLKDKIMSTTLMQLMEILSEEPFALPVVDPVDNKPGYSIKDSKSHEAGFDAFVTGVCFISMANYFASLGKKLINSPLISESPFIKPFVNRLFLSKVQDIPYMELMGKDSSPPRDHVFHLTFPSSWNTHNIRQLFGHFGSVYIAWLDDTSAYVALEDRTKASLVCKTLGYKTEFKSDGYKIISFLDYVKKSNKRPLPSDNSIKNIKGKDSSSQVVSQVNLNNFQESSLIHSTGGKRKRSLSESSFSKRSIDPIPEEMEDEVDKAAPDAKKDKEDSEVKEERVDDASNNSKPTKSPKSKKAKKTKIKEFDENDSWE